MPHIHTDPGHRDISTSSFIVRFHNDQPLFLLHQHKKLHALLPVGGHVELDESPWGTTLHEIEEESGYVSEQLKVLQPAERIKALAGVVLHPQPIFLQTHAFSGLDHSHFDIGYAFIADSLPRKLPADGESQELLWLSLEEISELGNKTHPDIVQIVHFIAETAIKTWETVPLDQFDE